MGSRTVTVHTATDKQQRNVYAVATASVASPGAKRRGGHTASRAARLARETVSELASERARDGCGAPRKKASSGFARQEGLDQLAGEREAARREEAGLL